MDPLTIFAIAVSLFAAGAVAYLTVTAVRSYLRQKLLEREAAEEAVLMKRDLPGGKTRIVTGFMNGGDLEDVKIWDADELDPTLRSLPSNEVLILH